MADAWVLAALAAERPGIAPRPVDERTGEALVSLAVMPREAPVVGDVPDQTRLRKPRPIKDLDEFLEFLARLEAVFGPPERRQELTVGDHFLL